MNGALLALFKHTLTWLALDGITFSEGNHPENLNRGGVGLYVKDSLPSEEIVLIHYSRGQMFKTTFSSAAFLDITK